MTIFAFRNFPPRSILAGLAAALLLAGCALGGHSGPPATVYDFGPPAVRAAAAPVSFAVEVRAPAWLDGTAIAYRLAYEDPLRLRAYAGSRWAGAPAQLLAQRLRQQLGAAAANGAVDCLLRVDVQEFTQVFDTAERSRGVVQAEAFLLDAHRRILARRVFSVERPAASQDARGGAAALVAASGQLGGELAIWLAGSDGARTCAPAAGNARISAERPQAQ